MAHSDMGPIHIATTREACGLPWGHCLFTFDDGPSGPVTEQLLLVLREFGVKACFCVVGSQVMAQPDQTRAIARDGHLLVNHTFSHQFRDLWQAGRLQSELLRCDRAIADAIGSDPSRSEWFRPPFGLLTNPVREIARTRRILPVTHFPVDTWLDSARASHFPDSIIRNAEQHGGGIYVLHDGLISARISNFFRGKPDRAWIPRAVAHILRGLQKRGFYFPQPSDILAKLAEREALFR